MQFPDSIGVARGQVRDEVVELMDVMPTLLDAAGVPVPDTVDGSSLLPLLKGETTDWRPCLHGECGAIPSLNSGMQYLTDGRLKYIWYPGSGEEHLFDIENDPREMVNLAADPAREADLREWRALLVQELAGRPEGFVEGGALRPVGGPTAPCLPGYERQ
jgi:arylsulfatase A-like enzyme